MDVEGLEAARTEKELRTGGVAHLRQFDANAADVNSKAFQRHIVQADVGSMPIQDKAPSRKGEQMP